jgi:5-formyltetrahydrofolate cyclo-ligase
MREMGSVADDLTGGKRELRRAMRDVRRALPDQAERSELLWSHVRALPAVQQASTVMVFASVPGEPVTAPFIVWLREQGKTVVLPEDDPAPDPSVVDVVIVPGTAFTAAGQRLGQGGGWYDRFLPQLRPGTPKIGVGFAPQLLPELPTEPHDVVLDFVVTDSGIANPPNANPPNA